MVRNMADNILNHPEFDRIASQLEDSRGLPRGSLRAVAFHESRGNPNAVSPVGAKGAFQFMDETARKYNVDVSNPWDSMRGAADYLGDNMKTYGGRFDAALADYNGGPPQASAVLKTGHPTAKETQGYVSNIMRQIDPGSPDERMKTIAGLKVFQAKQQGISDDQIVSGLIQTAPPQIAAVVRRNVQAGVSAADIVSGIASKQIEDDRKFREEINPTNGMSTTQKVLAGMGKSFVDTATGAKQLYERGKSLITGDDSGVRKLQQEVAETDSLDATLMATGAGKTGYVIGAVAPTIATLGAGAVANGTRLAATPSLARQVLVNPTTYKTAAANGALQGALAPTATDEEGMAAPALGALIGAATLGAGRGLGRIISPTQGAKATQIGENIAGAEAHGLDVTTGQLLKRGATIDSDRAFAQQALLNALKSRTTQEGTDALAANTAKMNEAIINKAGANGAQTLADAVPLSQKAVRDAYSAVFDGTQVPLNKTALNQKIDDLIVSNQAMMEESKVSQLTKLKAEVNRIAPSTAPAPGQADIAVVPGNVADQFIKRLNVVAKDNVGNQGFAGAIRDFRDEVQRQMEAGLGANRAAELSMAKELWNSKRLLEALALKARGTDFIDPKAANDVLFQKSFAGRNPLADIIKDGKALADSQLKANIAKQDEVNALAKALYGKSGSPKSSSGLKDMMSTLTLTGIGGGLGGNYAGGEGASSGALAGALLTKGGRHILANTLRDALLSNPNTKAAQYYLGQHAAQKAGLNALNDSSPVVLSLAQALAKSNREKSEKTNK